MTDLRKVARDAARRHGVPESVFVAQIQQESGFQPHIGSPAGAQGIAQIMPGTARAWGVDPNDPVAALDAAAKNMGRYIRKYGVEGALRAYNAGEGAIKASHGYGETNNYVKTILGHAGPGASRAPAPRRGSPGGGLLDAGMPAREVTTKPVTESVSGFDQAGYDQAKRRQLLGNMIAKHNPRSSLLKLGLLQTAEPDRSSFQTTSEVTTPGQKYELPGLPATSAAAAPSSSGAPRLGGGKAGHGKVSIFGGSPGRLKPTVVSFAKQVAAIYGKPLALNSGATHSKMTATGSVSQHYTGEATDIPASGAELTRMGRAALIAAGMPRAQAMKQTGGLFNVNGHQIIFHDRQLVSGSPHDDHLHISAPVKRR